MSICCVVAFFFIVQVVIIDISFQCVGGRGIKLNDVMVRGPISLTRRAGSVELVAGFSQPFAETGREDEQTVHKM